MDGCLGGFVAVFGGDLVKRKFDFRVPGIFNINNIFLGVTSISADHHKFGLAPKGVSIIMYSTEELRRY